MKQILFLIIALLALIILLILTILEAASIFHLHYPCGANFGPFRAHDTNVGAKCRTSEPITAYPDKVMIGGLYYNVRWIIQGKEGVILYEETEK